MIVRNLEAAERTDRRVVAENWESTRLLLKGDGIGFSFHITTIYPGTETCIWYKNHLESVYCIEGEGEVEVLDGMDSNGIAGDGGNGRFDEEIDGDARTGASCGRIYKITPGTLYVLDRHDRHLLRAKTALKLACVFNPPLIGGESHDEDGA
jgi:L-ectoine synthase